MKIHDINNLKQSIVDFLDSIAISPQSRVLLKPNFVSLDGYPYTTSPEIIQLVFEYMQDKGLHNITLADSPSVDLFAGHKHSNDEKMKKNEMRNFQEQFREITSNEIAEKYLEKHIEEIVRYQKFFFSENGINKRLNIKCDNLLELNLPVEQLNITENLVVSFVSLSIFDIIINMPVMKLHTTVGFTGATKNFFALFAPPSQMWRRR